MKIHRISIKNFVGVRSLELSPRAATLICGPNGAGKSSTIEAIRAALTGEIVRVERKKDWREMISSGERVGSAIVEHDAGRSAITLSSGKHEADVSNMPFVLPAVLDAGRFARLEESQRRAFVYALMNLNSTPAAIVDRMVSAHGADVTLCEEIRPLLNSGFDAALAHAKEQASQARGAWRAVTGEAYGSEKAKSWKPAPIEAPSDDEIAVLEADYEVSQNALLEAARIVGAIEEQSKQFAEQRARVEGLEATIKELPHAQARLERAKGELEIWSKRLDELPPAPGAVDVRPPMACPDCGSMLTLRNGGLHQHSPGKPDDHETAIKRQQWTKAVELQRSAITNAERDILAAERAKVELADMLRVEPVAEESVRSARDSLSESRAVATQVANALHRANADRKAAVDRAGDEQKAAMHHELVQKWDVISGALGPDGVRTAIVAEALGPINKALARHAAMTNWAVPQIGADMLIRVGACGHQYGLLSESEKWRVDALIAAAVAELSGARIFVLDRMDVLDLQSRGDLLYWLSDLITEDRIDQVFVAGTLKAKPAELPEHFEAVWLHGSDGEAMEAAA